MKGIYYSEIGVSGIDCKDGRQESSGMVLMLFGSFSTVTCCHFQLGRVTCVNLQLHFLLLAEKAVCGSDIPTRLCSYLVNF